MQADKRFRDVVGVSQSKDQLCRSIEKRLEMVEEVWWQTKQHSISVVQSAEYQRDDERLKCGR